jgi:peptidyl-prolyl cis-trans isomerase D
MQGPKANRGSPLLCPGRYFAGRSEKKVSDMFEFVRTHNRVLQFVLMLLIVPSFVVFGIQGYQRFASGNDEVAKVAGQSITRAEWDNAHRQQVERMRAQMPNVDIKMFDTPDMKARVLDQIVRDRVLFEASRKLNLAPSDDKLLRVFQNDPQFANVRNADGTPKKELLAIRGITSEQFALQLKQDLGMQQVLGGLGTSTPAAQTVATLALDAMFQRREVQVAKFTPAGFMTQVQASDAEIEAWYGDAKNGAQFQTPEVASIDYVVLDMASIVKGISVPADDLRKYYDENVSRYSQPEERHARHILIKTEAGDSADAKARNAKARVDAEALLTELKKNRAAFAELAKKQSQDPGSAARGGDLDWFGKGAMTQPFEDAAFALKKGELSGIVTSEFGLHIIEVLDARGGEKRSYDSVKAEIEEEVRKQLAAKKFAEAAEQFTDAVDQEDSLAPVAAKFKLELKKAEGVQRQPAQGVTGALANAKLLESVFNADNLAKKHNTQAVEIGTNQLASAHLLSYNPARKLPLAEVRDQVRNAVLATKAADAARADGEAKLKAWQADASTSGAALSASVLVSRNKTENQPRALVDAVLRAKADKLPAWVGVSLGAEGYAVVRVNKVMPADLSANGDAKQLANQYAQLWANAESSAYLGALRERFKAKITAKPGSSDTAASAAP